MYYAEISSFNYSLKRVRLAPERRNDPNALDVRWDYVASIFRIIALKRSEILFLDETGFNISMRSIYGRALLGDTLKKAVKQLRSKNLSMSCCMTKDRLVFYEVQERPYNRENYGKYLSRLFPILQDLNLHGCTFILDNVTFHRSAIIQNSIVAFGHTVLFPLTYSPVLNLIEEVQQNQMLG